MSQSGQQWGALVRKGPDEAVAVGLVFIRDPVREVVIAKGPEAGQRRSVAARRPTWRALWRSLIPMISGMRYIPPD